MTNPATDWTSTRLSTSGGIPYKKMAGSPTFSLSAESNTAQESYLIRASDLSAFYLESIPPPVAYFPWVTWPARRAMPGTSYFITKTINARPHTGDKAADPFGVDSGAPTDQYDREMVVDISYEVNMESGTERDESNPVTFLEHSIQAGGETEAYGPNKMQVTTGTVLSRPNAAGWVTVADRKLPNTKTIPTVEHQLRWDYVLSPPWATIYSYLGTVNNATFAFFNNALRETVLFMGISGTQKYLWNGASAIVQPWSLDYRFSQRYIVENGNTYGWNHVYVPQKNEWMFVRRGAAANANLLYEENDFAQLFRQA